MFTRIREQSTEATASGLKRGELRRSAQRECGMIGGATHLDPPPNKTSWAGYAPTRVPPKPYAVRRGSKRVAKWVATGELCKQLQALRYYRGDVRNRLACALSFGECVD